MGPAPQFMVLAPSMLFQHVEDPHHISQIQGIIRRVQIIQVARGADKKKPPFPLFAGRLDTLDFDAGCWKWPDNKPLHSYTTKRGRFFLHPRLELERTFDEKWANFVRSVKNGPMDLLPSPLIGLKSGTVAARKRKPTSSSQCTMELLPPTFGAHGFWLISIPNASAATRSSLKRWSIASTTAQRQSMHGTMQKPCCISLSTFLLLPKVLGPISRGSNVCWVLPCLAGSSQGIRCGLF
jgi:hypothetical protein